MISVLRNLLQKNTLYEMANLPKRITNVNNVIHIWSDQGRTQHTSRIKIFLQRPSKNAKVIELFRDRNSIIVKFAKKYKVSTQDIKQFVRFYELNIDLINDYSNGGQSIYLDTDELNKQIIPYDEKDPQSNYIVN